ncbi:hypothetical protein [Pontibacter sp. H249]|uniref:hypothetical protein n=1 Tax=Pontibacter sp. H249 TaxID=3133420 RepID=UPI0030BCB47E
MKKAHLLPLLLFILITACNTKEPSPAPTANELIKGKWTSTSIMRKYYDESGTLIHQKVEDSGWYYDFDGIKYSISVPPVKGQQPATYTEAFSGKYTVEQVNGKDYYSFVENGVTVEISDISEARMTWLQISSIRTYYQGGTEMTADSAVQITMFARR